MKQTRKVFNNIFPHLNDQQQAIGKLVVQFNFSITFPKEIHAEITLKRMM